MPAEVNISREEAIAALRSAAHRGSDGRTTIHSFLGSIGADHDLDRAVDLVEQSTARGWVDGFIGHDLAVVVDGRQYLYDIRRPEAKQEVDF